jgi:hypothetical protein
VADFLRDVPVTRAQEHFFTVRSSETRVWLQFVNMSSLRRSVIVLLVLASGAVAAEPASHVGLDYRAEKDCPSADHFRDEVSAKLGFVPWDAAAGPAIRIRIARDGTDVVGTIEQPDGASKVVRGATCAAVAAQLVTTVTVALDAPAAPLLAAIDAHGKTELGQSAPDDGLVDVRLRPLDGRQLGVSRVTARTTSSGYVGAHYSYADGTQYVKLCDLPCTTRLPRGSNTLIVRDVATDLSIYRDTVVDVSSTLDVTYVSRRNQRSVTESRTKWGFLVGFLVGTAAFAYYIESDNDNPAFHILDPMVGAGGALVGALVGLAVSPGYPGDDARIAVHPGLQTAWKF